VEHAAITSGTGYALVTAVAPSNKKALTDEMISKRAASATSAVRGLDPVLYQLSYGRTSASTLVWLVLSPFSAVAGYRLAGVDGVA
jgi:hypothetical protein